MNVLIYSPTAATIAELAPFVRADGHHVEEATSAEDAAAFLMADMIDVGIVDCAPDAVLHPAIATLQTRSPVLAFAEPLNSRNVIVDLLDSGADDAMVLPVKAAELFARLRALRRRGAGARSTVITIGRFSFDTNSRKVLCDGNEVHVTSSQGKVLEALMLHQSRTMTKEQLLTALYGGRDEPELKIIDVFVCKLRRALSDASGGDGLIETIWGQGYRIPAEAAAERAAA